MIVVIGQAAAGAARFLGKAIVDSFTTPVGIMATLGSSYYALQNQEIHDRSYELTETQLYIALKLAQATELYAADNPTIAFESAWSRDIEVLGQPRYQMVREFIPSSVKYFRAPDSENVVLQVVFQGTPFSLIITYLLNIGIDRVSVETVYVKDGALTIPTPKESSLKENLRTEQEGDSSRNQLESDSILEWFNEQGEKVRKYREEVQNYDVNSNQLGPKGNLKNWRIQIDEISK